MNTNNLFKDFDEEVIDVPVADDEEPTAEELTKIEMETSISDGDYANFSTLDTLGFYCDQAKKFALLTDEEVLELAKAKDGGDETAMKTLVEHNLCLVIKMALHYAKNSEQDINDLIQDGNIGLMNAAQKFDYTKGFRFSTYATWWIRQAIFRGISNNSGVIRLPEHERVKRARIMRTEKELATKLLRYPTLSELSEATEVSMEEIDKIKLSSSVVSLSLPANAEDDDSAEIEDFLTDEAFNIEKKVEESELNADLRNYLVRILKNERSLQAVLLHYGLDENSDSRTLDEIGEQLGITRERVRQLIGTAFRILRKNKKFCNRFKNSLNF